MPGWQRGDSNCPYRSLGAGGTCGDALADAEAVNARLEAVNAHAAMRLQMRRVGPPSGAVMGAVYGRDAAAGSRDRVEIACGHVCGVARCRELRPDHHPIHSAQSTYAESETPRAGGARPSAAGPEPLSRFLWARYWRAFAIPSASPSRTPCSRTDSSEGGLPARGGNLSGTCQAALGASRALCVHRGGGAGRC